MPITPQFAYLVFLLSLVLFGLAFVRFRRRMLFPGSALSARLARFRAVLWGRWTATRAILASIAASIRAGSRDGSPRAMSIPALVPSRPSPNASEPERSGMPENVDDQPQPEPVIQSTVGDGNKVAHVQVTADIPAGMALYITIESEPDHADGTLPVRATLVPRAGVQSSLQWQSGLGSAWSRVWDRAAKLDLAVLLFGIAILLYLATRLIGLDKFPIYFFTDEAIQTQSMADLVQRGYRDVAGQLLPTFFQNGLYFNLGTSVYAQWLPYLLFGKSAVVTRATSALITVIAAVAVGIILRNIFKLKYWWTGVLLLSITPAWFLHSRTAFETAEFVALYAGALCTYLLYRYKSPRYLYLTLVFSALAFYTYSPGQVVVAATSVLLLLSDWRYHWENRRTLLIGMVLLAVLVLPYVRFRLANPDDPFNHLREMGSYLVEPTPVKGKILKYLSEFAYGLSPGYWYIPNERDLARHLMKGYGNIMLATLPFALVGLAYVLRNLRESACRVMAIALLVTPAGAALVEIGITRVLSFVVPLAIVTAIGLDHVLRWVEKPTTPPVQQPDSIPVGGIAYVVGLVAFLYFGGASTNRFVFIGLLVIQTLALAVVVRRRFVTDLAAWGPSPVFLSLGVFAILAAANVGMLRDALVNGQLWYSDYGMGGLQYGSFQLFDILKQYQQEHPDTKIIFTPNWANGTDTLARFFLGDNSPIELGNIDAYLTYKRPLDENIMFVMLQDEFDRTNASGKFQDIHVERTIPYPDGQPGFYFVRLRYVDNIDEILAAEAAARRVLQNGVVTIDGQSVPIRYSNLDMGDISLLFDQDTFTVARTMEANPFVIELTFAAPRTIKEFSIIVGSIQAHIKLDLYPSVNAQPVEYTFDGRGSVDKPGLTFELPQPTETQFVHLELLDPNSSEPTHVHIWEISFR